MFPEFLNETISLLFSRIYLFADTHGAVLLGWKDESLFKGILMRGVAFLLSKFPELNYLFLKYRVDCINVIRKNLMNLSDRNSITTFTLTSHLYRTCSFFKDSTYKDFFSLAAGPGILLKLVLENPDSCPNTLSILQNYADGFIFTNKYVWFPPYSSNILYEFNDMLREFGEEYLMIQKMKN